MKIIVQIWDWPLRLFHWLLVFAVTGCFITGKLGGSLTDWHARFGSLVLGLLVFRVVWGFIGGTHSRFADFFPTPQRLIKYFKGEWQGRGHNPAGAVIVICLLGILSALAITGLFANDDIAFEGPLFDWISKDLSDALSGWHSLGVNVLLGLVSLHVSAIIFYLHIKKTNLVIPMLTGKKQLPKSLAGTSIHQTGIVGFLVSMLAAVSVVWVVWNVDYSHVLTQLASL